MCCDDMPLESALSVLVSALLRLMHAFSQERSRNHTSSSMNPHIRMHVRPYVTLYIHLSVRSSVRNVYSIGAEQRLP